MKNWSLLTSLFLSSLILYNTLRVSFTYIYYNVDTIGFIEKLCENKDKPEMHCDGKCQLKKVTQNSQSDEKVPIQLIDFKDVLLFKETNTSYSFINIYTENQNLFSYTNNYSFINLNTSFHPPQKTTIS